MCLHSDCSVLSCYFNSMHTFGGTAGSVTDTVLTRMCGGNCVGIVKEIWSFSFSLYNFNSDLFMFSSNNANQKGSKEWMGLNWSCNCCLEGGEQTGEECVRASPTWLLPSPERVQDPAVLHARVGSPHTPPPSSTFPSS